MKRFGIRATALTLAALVGLSPLWPWATNYIAGPWS